MSRNCNSLAMAICFCAVASINAANGSDSVDGRAITISSKVAATPAKPNAFDVVAFTVTATGAGTLSYSWDFGDGSPAITGATPSHTYTVAGSYTVTATITDSAESATSTLALVVADVIKSGKIVVNLNFAEANKDSFRLTGTIRVAPNAVISGQVVTLNVGGVTKTYTLDENGGSNAVDNEMFKIFIKHKADNVGSADVKFYLLATNGSFQSAWKDEGMIDADADRQSLKVKVTLTFLGNVYTATLTQQYNASKGKKGKMR